MTIFDGQFEVVIKQFESTLKASWMATGMAEGVVDQRTWRLVFRVSFSEVVVSSFKGTWNIRKQHAYPDTTPLIPVQHILSLLVYATFRLAQIVTVDSNF